MAEERDEHSSLFHRLSKQRAVFGLLNAFPGPVTELAGLCGYDFVILDGEHGIFGDAEYLNALRTLAATTTLGFIRVRTHDSQAIGRYLDFGVDGVIAPNVATAGQAVALAAAMVYPPAGSRGMGAPMHRGTRFGRDLTEHLNNPRGQAVLIAMIESKTGVENAAEILAVEGVDGVLVGPWDLSASLGCPGDFSQPSYGEALRQIEAAATAHRKILGTVPHPGNSLEDLIARGYRLLILNDDISTLREAMTAQVGHARSRL